MTNYNFDNTNQGQRMPAVMAVAIDPLTGEASGMDAKGPAIVTAPVMTRPADTVTYAAGDLIANSTAAGSVTPITIAAARAINAPTQFRRMRISSNDPAWATANAIIRVHLFRGLPVPANGDNGAFLTPIANYVGRMDVTMDRLMSDGSHGAGAPSTGGEITSMPADGTVNWFALLEARTTVTPASGRTFVLTAELWRG